MQKYLAFFGVYKKRIIVLLMATLLLIGSLGWLVRPYSDSSSEWLTAEKFQLISIDGRFDQYEIKASPTFHGYPVLGQVDITDANQRRKIIAAYQEGLRARGPSMKCWWPRHGIHIVQTNNNTIECLICFQCRAFGEYHNANFKRGGAFGGNQDKFDKPLSDAGVPIAPNEPLHHDVKIKHPLFIKEKKLPKQ